jgi:hypothetical protein
MYYAKLRTLSPLGFIGSDMFPSDTQSLYYKRLPKWHCVLVVSNLVPQSIQVFRLSKDHYNKFRKGSLSLIPNGCCNAIGGNSIENPDMLWIGDFTSSKQVARLVTTYESLLMEEKGNKNVAKPKKSSKL